jgi:DMSO/TMAO reductase YedYZ molybdopterin-dependent catalytic subunit
MRYTRLPLGLFAVCCILSVTTAQTNQQTAAAAPLIVRGDIPAALTLTAEDLLRMPRETVSVADQDGIKVNYEGVNLREILKRADVLSGKELRGKALASYVLAKARDGYQVVFSLGELDAAFGNESILIADKRDGKPLFGYEGPFRLVCPNDKAGARSVRMLDTLEVVRLQK